MLDQIIGEQFILIGQVDVPATPDSTMRLLAKLGPAGFMPSIVQEVSMVDGRSQNRLSFNNMADVVINFNSDRVTLTRSPDQSGTISSKPFLELVKQVCSALLEMDAIDTKRVVLLREKFLADYPEPKMQEVCRKFVGIGAEVSPFEWFSRVSSLVEVSDKTILKVVEVGRTQGVVQVGGVQKNFDRVRSKIEIGTNMFDEQARYSISQASDLAVFFEDELSKAYAEVEKNYHE